DFVCAGGLAYNFASPVTTSSTIFLSVKASGSTQPPRALFVGADWARLRDVNGKESVLNRVYGGVGVFQDWRGEGRVGGRQVRCCGVACGRSPRFEVRVWVGSIRVGSSRGRTT